MVETGRWQSRKWTSKGNVNRQGLISEDGAFPLQKEECDGIRRAGIFHVNTGGTADWKTNLSCVEIFVSAQDFFIKGNTDSCEASKKSGG